MNSCTFIGRLGKDAELKTLDGGKQVINFSLAVDDGKDRPPVWVDCARWSDKTAIMPYLLKGTQIAVQGQVGLRKWDGGATITLRVDKVELLGGKPANAATTGNATGEDLKPMIEPIDDLPF